MLSSLLYSPAPRRVPGTEGLSINNLWMNKSVNTNRIICGEKEHLNIYLYFMENIYNVSLLFSCSVVSDSSRPHGLQHARLPWPSPSPRACSHSCPLSRWCHPPISSSAVPFSSCAQSFPASGSLVHSSHQVATVLEFQLQHQSFQWIFRIDFF